MILEKAILKYILKSGQAQSVNSIKTALKMTEYRVRKAIRVLEQKNLIRKIGSASSTKYTVGIGRAEFLTQLQMIMEFAKRELL